MTRMFQAEGHPVKTWSPVTGCLHACNFCWARRLAEGRLCHQLKYSGGFYPAVHPEELRRRFYQGLIFVCDMADLFGEWVPREWIEAVLQVIRESPKATFLLLTKNPYRYQEFMPLPPNAIAGATIETTYNTGGGYGPLVSLAPEPFLRYMALRELQHPRKFVSIEPILDFDLEVMVGWMRQIAPEFVYLGMDNHNHHLPEPPLEKTLKLIEELKQFTEVRLKTVRRAWNE